MTSTLYVDSRDMTTWHANQKARMWRCCSIEGCYRPTRHEALCWRCMVQLISYLMLRGVSVARRYDDREMLITEAKELCGCVGEDGNASKPA